MKKLSVYLSMMIAIMSASSCRKNTDVLSGNSMIPPPTGSAAIPVAADGMPMQLGAQLNNPYTPAHMQWALDSLNDAGVFSEKPFMVRVTHRYLKYYPQNQSDIEILESDSNLIYFDHPLDYAVTVQGNYYQDPDLPDSMPTPLYVVVPDGYNYNTTMSYEILEELYLPEEDVQLLGPGLNENLEFANKLIGGAFNHAGTFLEPATPWSSNGGPSGGGGGVPPVTGQIRTFDNRLNAFIPLEGVFITATRWFTSRWGHTSANGTYTLTGDPFQRQADYAIRFETGNFKIRLRHYFIDARIVRNNIPGNTWSYDIVDGTDRMHATMFRAAYRYYYGNVAGLKRPIRPNASQNIISKYRRNGGALNWVVFPNITIARNENGMSGREYDCDEIFSTTIHELAHTAHVLTMSYVGDYANVSLQIMESWATGVEWFITRMEYQERGIANYMEWNYTPGTTYDNNIIQPIVRGYQYWNINVSSDYTTLFVNLVDDFNENGIGFGAFPRGSVDDPVTGYNLSTIQINYLKHIYAPSSLFNQLNNNRPAGVTTAQLNTLLSHY